MAYRISVKNQNGKYHQLLGNNECYIPLLEYLKSQGCNIDEDSCFEDFEITDLPSVIGLLMEYLKRADKESLARGWGGIYDLTPSDEEDKWSLYTMLNLQECAYIFVITNLIKAFPDDIKHVLVDRELTYVIREGHKLFISGY